MLQQPLLTGQKAAYFLGKMGSAAAVESGLLGDWAAEALTFVRSQDKSDPDPALFQGHLNKYLERLDLLFIQGRILLSPDAHELKTCVAHSIQTAKAVPPIFYGGRVKVLWEEQAGAEAAVQALGQFRQAARDTSARLHAEFDNYILTDFMCFDLGHWRKAFRLPAEQRDLAIQNLTRQYVRLCQTLGLPVHQQSEARVRKELRLAARCLITSNPEAVAVDEIGCG